MALNEQNHNFIFLFQLPGKKQKQGISVTGNSWTSAQQPPEPIRGLLSNEIEAHRSFLSGERKHLVLSASSTLSMLI
jgi:hypothetical protein